jgi:hypothetical protein
VLKFASMSVTVPPGCTVSVAVELVTVPATLETTTSNVEPLSVTAVGLST